MKHKKKHRGQSATFMRSINPHLKHKSSGKRKIYKVRHPSYSMAKKRSHKRSFGKSMLSMSPIIGAVGYSIAEPFIDQLASKVGLSVQDDIVKVGIGVVAPRIFKNKIVSEISKAAVYIGVHNLSQGFTSKLTTNTTTTNGGATF